MLMYNKELKKFYQIQLPKRMKFEFDDDKLVLKVAVDEKYVCENMQENNAAFEGWIFCLLRKFGKVKDVEVELDWDVPENGNGHYHRFLYRVMKMQEHFSWFRISKQRQTLVDSFKEKYYDCGKLYLNIPDGTEKKINKKDSESYMEQIFFDKDKLKKQYGLETVGRQLPVGVFKGCVSGSTYVFTGGKSAIDLWGIKDDTLYIFELKFKNKMVGIVSETLFYLWVMEDVMFTGKMKYEDKAKNINYRNFNAFYNSIGKISNIYAVFLIDELHPQIDEEVVRIINQENMKKGQCLQICKYKASTDVEFI